MTQNLLPNLPIPKDMSFESLLLVFNLCEAIFNEAAQQICSGEIQITEPCSPRKFEECLIKLTSSRYVVVLMGTLNNKTNRQIECPLDVGQSTIQPFYSLI